jgi:signal transduction histidine kinase
MTSSPLQSFPTGPVDGATGGHVLPWSEPSHGVQFYEEESFLARAIADYLGGALTAGEPAVVIATAARRAAVWGMLAERGLDAAGAEMRGDLVFLEADAALASFMEGDLPNSARFHARIGRVVERMARRKRGVLVRLYGEMVDLLWKGGRIEGALRLEELWNELGRRHSFTLLCGYAMSNFSRASDVERFRQVCRHHSHVIPTERWTRVDDVSRLVEIGEMQQRSRALESEILERSLLEHRLREALGETERLLHSERAARAEAEQARRVAEEANRVKGEFLAVMSHELRTPLNAIAGYAELLELGVHGPLSEQQREALARIQRSQQHLLGLINEVLSYARVESGGARYVLEPVPMDEALRAADALVLPQMRARELEYECTGCDETLVAWADREKVQQILLNLLVNAAKFTERGGRVSVECEQAGASVIVRVQDTGVGIPAERLDAIFEPFFQVDSKLTRTHDGVGLGLAISRNLARGMGGDLTAESRPDFGSTFTLVLPVGPAQPA